MIYSNIKTYYINSEDDLRVVRYDLIKIDNDTYQVKVIDEQQRGINHPSSLVQIDDFLITRNDYNKKYPTGFQRSVSLEMAPGFENSIEGILQNHRNRSK